MIGIYFLLPTLLAILFSFLIVRAASVALMMTGLEKNKARFQALSAFSGTGFTTKESESIVNHPRRRQIIRWLMITGNAGIATVIVTATSSMATSRGYQLPVNVVFIIGAMVIAPALGPNVALSLGTTLGDGDLSRRALKTIFVGSLWAFVFSALIGILLEVNPQIPEIFTRTEVNFGDIALALSAGSAAVLSLSSGLVSALIGVMVAVALLPPLVTMSMLVGAGQWELAIGSLQLFFVNFICVNLAGVITFLFQGVRPLTWWEANRA